MTVQRLRAFLVTIALVVGAGTVSAVAAPLLTGDDGNQALGSATEAPSEASSEATEDLTEPVEDPTDTVGDPEGSDEATNEAKDKRPKAGGDPGERKASKAGAAKGPAARGGNGKGNAHGKAVSEAARGVTPPVGDCRNHGHWVSTVAKGMSSCDENPRPAAGADD